MNDIFDKGAECHCDDCVNKYCKQAYNAGINAARAKIAEFKKLPSFLYISEYEVLEDLDKEIANIINKSESK